MVRREQVGTPSGVGPGAGEVAGDERSRWVARAARMLERSCGLCREIEALGACQGEAVRSGDTESLLRVLGARQQLVDELTALTAELEPLRSRWGAELARLAPKEREPLERQAAELTSLLEAIGRRDEADRAVLESQRGRVGEELRSVMRGRGAVAAYGERERAGARFQDRQG
jgi:hypothetical protein